MNWMTTLQIGGFVISWLARASIDGKITGKEMAELIDGVAKMAGFELEFDVPKEMKPDGKIGKVLQTAGGIAAMSGGLQLP
ncbi:MAG: hypothetical protein ACR2RB_15765 [Gammaproteobacteria bacterium]